jgi:hypothetical protein
VQKKPSNFEQSLFKSSTFQIFNLQNRTVSYDFGGFLLKAFHIWSGLHLFRGTPGFQGNLRRPARVACVQVSYTALV